jgi:hypothetical protein
MRKIPTAPTQRKRKLPYPLLTFKTNETNWPVAEILLVLPSLQAGEIALSMMFDRSPLSQAVITVLDVSNRKKPESLNALP